MFIAKLSNKNFYKASIRSIRLKLQKLEKKDLKTQKIRVKELKNWEDLDEVLYYQDFSYILKIICFKIINQYYENFFIGYFGTEKT